MTGTFIFRLSFENGYPYFYQNRENITIFTLLKNNIPHDIRRNDDTANQLGHSLHRTGHQQLFLSANIGGLEMPLHNPILQRLQSSRRSHLGNHVDTSASDDLLVDRDASFESSYHPL